MPTASYDPSQPTAKDRVRAMISDRSAPFEFFDDEIVAELSRHPSGDTGELEAAISLLEQRPDSSGAIKTIKQGSVQRIDQSGVGDRATILASLRARLGASAGVGLPAVADGFAPEGPCPGFGFLIR